MRTLFATVLVVLFAFGIGWHITFGTYGTPALERTVAVNQLQDSEVPLATTQAVQRYRPLIAYLGYVPAFLTLLVYFYRKRRVTMKKTALASLLIAALLLPGCIKPYPGEKTVEIKNNETAFAIPLEGASKSTQAKFASIEFLEGAKVATKRIIIPRRWKKTGRLPSAGEWIDTLTIITVDRTPVTRQWTPEASTGTGHGDQSIQVESADSVGFSIGFGCTAMVRGDDTATFLYYYPSGSLARVMDSEIRERIQRGAANECARYDLDILRAKKNEVQTALETDVTSFYAQRGITITTVSMFGGFAYDNPEIQDAIDKVFVAQQEKTVAKALLDAQADKNKRLEMEGEGEALKAIKIANGEAEALRIVNKAAEEARENPLFLELKQLEIEQARIDAWDGKYPQWMMSSGDASLLISPPPLAAR